MTAGEGIAPLSIKEANVLVAKWHRHHKPVHGAKFAIGLVKDGDYVGAAIVGRPVARAFDNGTTAEVTRLVTDGTANACSALYAACWRAWHAMGGERLITYTLASEPGTSLRAAGWRLLYQTKGGSWDRPSRPRVTENAEPKQLWECDGYAALRARQAGEGEKTT